VRKGAKAEFAYLLDNGSGGKGEERQKKTLVKVGSQQEAEEQKSSKPSGCQNGRPWDHRGREKIKKKDVTS